MNHNPFIFTHISTGRKKAIALVLAGLALSPAAAMAADHYVSINQNGNATRPNYNNDGATGSYAIAIGTWTEAAGFSATAVGSEASASEQSAVAVGAGAEATGVASSAYGGEASATANGATALGRQSVASGSASTAVGSSASATDQNATAVGTSANASGNGSSAFGLQASASANQSVAIGRGASATEDSSVALGSNSTTEAAVGTSSATVNGVSYSGFAGSTPASTVSVGSSGAERTITNVAAGRISADSTDAINGSQLYMVADQVGTNTANIATNATNIETNAGNIETNAANITSNTGNIATNAANIATNTGNIETNAANIANNTATINQGLNFTGDSGTFNRQLGDTVNVVGDGNNITTTAANGTITVNMSDDPTFNSVTATTVNAGTVNATTALNVSNGATVNMGDNVVNGVAAGEVSSTSTQAVNGSQLYEVNQRIDNIGGNFTSINNRIDKMDKDLRAGIAGATAIAFLQRPNEPGKSMVSAAVGGYRGEQALAIGYARNADNNKWSTKVGVGVNTQKDLNWGGSVGYQW